MRESMRTCLAVFLLLVLLLIGASDGALPVVIATWPFKEAVDRAWSDLNKGKSSLDALENGMRTCQELQCDGTVGWGGSPDENGETTLDALIFDGVKFNMGAVAGLRRIKDAAGVARRVLENTEHSLIVGDQATKFALMMGFTDESLSSPNSTASWKVWKKNHCQPNYWKKVQPDPKSTCGPYTPLSENSVKYFPSNYNNFSQNNHDTIAMLVIDKHGYVVAGTSTNGANHKIPGRVGDSPIPGAGAYADADVGAAGCTGDGDKMMRFLPSFMAVEEMRRGNSPTKAARTVIENIAKKFPKFFGAIIVVNKTGVYGAACNGMEKFPFAVIDKETGKVTVEAVACTNDLKYT